MIRAQMVLITILMPAVLAAQQWIDVTGKGNLFRRRETREHVDTTTVHSPLYSMTSAIISANTSNVSTKKLAYSVGTTDSSSMVVKQIRNGDKNPNAKPKTESPHALKVDSSWVSWSSWTRIIALDSISHRSGDHGDEGYRVVSFYDMDPARVHKHYKTKKKK